jgi:hypothetical protein
VTLATADGYLEWIVPLLGLIVGTLGAVHAARGGASAWATLFIVLAVLIVALLALGFLVVVVVAVLTFSSRDQTLQAVGTVVFDISLLFPIAALVTALIYAWRGTVRAGKAQVHL